MKPDIDETAPQSRNPQLIDQFARELAVALRRIIGLTASEGKDLPTVAVAPDRSNPTGKEV